MIDKIVIFTGSKKDFEAFITENIPDIDEDTITIPFLELIQHYNARIRPNESGVKESDLSRIIKVDNCIVRAEDYRSVLEHVLSNFISVVTRNHDIETLYIHNPPKRVMRSLVSAYSDIIEYHQTEYKDITKDVLKEVYFNLSNDILGQDECKKSIVSALYRLSKTSSINRPVVLMLYGPSGVGKTETAKSISKTLGGELLRVQFSMMQTSEAYNYVFGAEHSKGSFASDMMSRESNVILIDEFDKVNPAFYNAFYELFDEGRYVDSNYEVDLKRSIFLCTCNFMNEDEIRKALGPAMHSRIGCCIEYADLSYDQKCQIISKWHSDIMNRLSCDEQAIICETDILKWFILNADRYDNIRTLKSKLENAMFDELTYKFIISPEDDMVVE